MRAVKLLPFDPSTGVGLREALLLAAIVYAIWTPFYFLLKPEPVIPPAGDRVELIMKVARNEEAGRSVDVYGFRRREADLKDPRPLVVYEDVAPLPADHYEIEPVNPQSKWRPVKFKASDGSDPRYNGRRYYAVLPKAPAP